MNTASISLESMTLCHSLYVFGLCFAAVVAVRLDVAQGADFCAGLLEDPSQPYDLRLPVPIMAVLMLFSADCANTACAAAVDDRKNYRLFICTLSITVSS